MWPGEVRATVRVPKGFPGWYFNAFDLDNKPGSKHPHEYEWAGPAGMRMRVIDALKDPDGKWRLVVEPIGFTPLPGEVSPQTMGVA